MTVTSQTRSVSNRRQIVSALVVSGVVTLLTLGVAFGLLVSGIELFWVAFPVGFGGVFPVALNPVGLRDSLRRVSTGWWTDSAVPDDAGSRATRSSRRSEL
jgi:hypothetical protein